MNDHSPIHFAPLEHDGVTLATATLRPTEEGEPIFVWLPGYGSNMNGAKATWLTRQCATWSLPLLKLDFRGTGDSTGDFDQATLSDWVADALFAVENLTSGPVILVGSSLGAWIALRVAQRCERVKALALVSAAPDFTKRYWESCPPAEQEAWRTTGKRTLGHNGLSLSYKLLQDANANHLVLGGPIAFDGPVSLLHGMKDDVAPWQNVMKTQELLTSEDVTLHLVKDGDHALGRTDDLALLWQELTRLRDKLTGPVLEIPSEF